MAEKGLYSSFDLFQTALYHEAINSIPEFLKVYKHLLRDNDTDKSIMHSNRINQYLLEITNRPYLNELRTNFNQLYNLIDTEFPDIRFNITGRIKSVTSMDRKIVKHLNKNKSLDKIMDTAAFRVIIFGYYSEEELVKECYTIMNSIIKYNNMLGFTLCDADEVQDIMKPEIIKDSGLIIPNSSLIEPIYENGLKDYILQPKENGYQSLHASFRRINGGQCFEVQVRTLAMHAYAESGDACHKTYKKNKYEDYVINPDMVFIPGFGLYPDGSFYDFIGLVEGLQILQRQKVF